MSEGKKLGVRVDESTPAGLFMPRRIETISQIADIFWNQSGRIYLRATNDDTVQSLVSGGAHFDRHGVYIKKDSAAVNFGVLDAFLPFVARKEIRPILGDMIPSSSWGSSLCNMLTKASWDGIRGNVFSSAGNRCEICGSTRDLECHELWEYHEPINSNVPAGMTAFGVQKLIRLMSLCDDCHETYHLGFANSRGRLDIALNRIGAINRWSGEEVADYYHFIGSRWARRNNYGWVLDVSILRQEILVVKSNWVLNEDGFLLATTPSGDSVTMLLGARWKYARDLQVRDAVSPDIAYFD